MARLSIALAVTALGVLGATAPARAEECACTPAEPSACVLDVPAHGTQAAHTVVLWCERADDPRCQPASPTPTAPRIGYDAPVALAPAPFALPMLGDVTEVWARSVAATGPSGHRNALERPPRTP